MLPDQYLDEFDRVLSLEHYGESSRRMFRTMLRRMARQLDESDLRDPDMMRQFRTVLPIGSRSILSLVWRLLRETDVGRDLPEIPRVRLVTYPHPLSADVTHLGAVFGNERLPELTWAEASTSIGWDELTLDAAGRVWWYFMPAEVEPQPDSPLVVKDTLARPMQLWQVRYIINSADFVQQSKKPLKEARLVKLADRAIFVASRLRVDAAFLKAMCRRIELVGDAQVDVEAISRELEAAMTARDTSRLAGLFDGLPVGDDSAL